MKKIISILLLSVICVMCFVGCTATKSEKAYSVEYNDEGYVESITLLIKLKNDLKPTEQFIFGGERWDSFTLDGERYSYGLFDEEKKPINYLITSDYNRFKELQSYRVKGDVLLLKVNPYGDIRTGTYSFCVFDEKAYTEFYDKTVPENVDIDKEKDLLKKIDNYIERNATKYTFIF